MWVGWWCIVLNWRGSGGDDVGVAREEYIVLDADSVLNLKPCGLVDWAEVLCRVEDLLGVGWAGCRRCGWLGQGAVWGGRAARTLGVDVVCLVHCCSWDRANHVRTAWHGPGFGSSCGRGAGVHRELKAHTAVRGQQLGIPELLWRSLGAVRLRPARCAHNKRVSKRAVRVGAQVVP